MGYNFDKLWDECATLQHLLSHFSSVCHPNWGWTVKSRTRDRAGDEATPFVQAFKKGFNLYVCILRGAVTKTDLLPEQNHVDDYEGNAQLCSGHCEGESGATSKLYQHTDSIFLWSHACTCHICVCINKGEEFQDKLECIRLLFYRFLGLGGGRMKSCTVEATISNN